MNRYINTENIAQRRNKSVRQVQLLCQKDDRKPLNLDFTKVVRLTIDYKRTIDGGILLWENLTQ